MIQTKKSSALLLIGLLQYVAVVNTCRASGASDVGYADIEKLIDLKNPEEAAVAREFKLYPDNPDLLIRLAKLKDASGKYAEAIAMLRKARWIAPSYEDVYLLEAIMLAKLNNRYACDYKKDLRKSYELVENKKYHNEFDRHLASINSGYFESAIGAGYDKLSDGRGHWNSQFLSEKYVDCSSNSYYGGYEKIKRYEINDEEYHVGLAVPLNSLSYSLEYRASSQNSLLPKDTYYGLLRYGFNDRAGLNVAYTRRNYIDIESQSTGFGVDYYFADYQLELSRQWVTAKSSKSNFGTTTVDKLGFTYYMSKHKYIGMILTKGTELNYDQSDTPPFGEISTIVLKGLYPFSHGWAVSYELVRHHQRGYFYQSGGRLGVRYRY